MERFKVGPKVLGNFLFKVLVAPRGLVKKFKTKAIEPKLHILLVYRHLTPKNGRAILFSVEKELASEIVELLKQSSVKKISLPKLLDEIEVAVIKFMKYDHETKSTLAQALKINRTTLSEKMKRYRINL